MKSPQTPRVCLRLFALISISLCSARYAAAATETLFTTQTPRLSNVSDGSTTNRELGIRFTSGVAGRITAIRFWKASRETGSHIGHLWNASGQLLASVNFVNETASGWQQQSLATPDPESCFGGRFLLRALLRWYRAQPIAPTDASSCLECSPSVHLGSAGDWGTQMNPPAAAT